MVDAGSADTAMALESVMELSKQIGWVTWGFREEPMGALILQGLERQMRTCLSDLVTFLLGEMSKDASDASVQGLGVRILMKVAQSDEGLKKKAVECGAIAVLSKVLGAFTSRPNLLAPALKAVGELKGLAAYIEVLPSILHSLEGCQTALSTIVDAMKKGDRGEVAALPKEETMKVILNTADRHKADRDLVCDAFKVLEILLGDDQYRIIFSNFQAYQWLLQVLALHMESPSTQTVGCKIISAVAEGGCLSEAHISKTTEYFQTIIEKHQQEEELLSWALWAVQKMNGVAAIVQPILAGRLQSPRILRMAMTSIRCMSFTQSDGAGPEQMPCIVDGALYALRSSTDRDTVYEVVTILGRAASSILGSSLPEQQRQAHIPHAGVAVEVILQVMEHRITDAQMVMACIRALKETLDACNESQVVIREALKTAISSKKDARGANLLGLCISAHCSHEILQSVVLELRGALEGVRAVLTEMQNNPTIESVQLSGARAIGTLYEEVDLDHATKGLAVECLQHISDSMTAALENRILQQHSCFAMYSIMEALRDEPHWLPDEAIVVAIRAAVAALASVSGIPDKDHNTGSWDAMYVRKECMRCLGGCLQARPSVCKTLLRVPGLAQDVWTALETTITNIWDHLHDEDLEETLTLELIAISSFQPLHVALTQTLVRWGPTKPAVVRAVADAACDLIRGATTRPGSEKLSEIDAAFMVVSALDNPRQALASFDFAGKLSACVKANFPNDERLVERCTLTSGFLAHVPPGLPFDPTPSNGHMRGVGGA